jgi:hypothetical protein
MQLWTTHNTHQRKPLFMPRVTPDLTADDFAARIGDGLFHHLQQRL